LFFSLQLAALLQHFAVGEFLSFASPKERNQRQSCGQLWTALAGPEGIKAKLLQKATPDRSKARNKINGLRRWGNSVPGRHTTSVGGLKHSRWSPRD
jgi:hypothetical protein